MQAAAASAVMLSVFGLGAGELILILTLVLILIGARKLPDIARGFGRGICEFRKATREVTDEMDEAASEAGRSLGGIYGKPAAEALTPDNHIAELYDPAAPQDKSRSRGRWLVAGFVNICRLLRRFVRLICGHSRYGT